MRVSDLHKHPQNRRRKDGVVGEIKPVEPTPPEDLEPKGSVKNVEGIESMTTEELRELMLAEKIDIPIKGTGSGDSVVKQDLIDAVLAAQAKA